MPVCAFEAPVAAGAVAVNVNGSTSSLVLARSGTANGSTACDFVLLTNAEYDQIFHAVLVAPPAPPVPLDPVQVGAFFSFGLATVVACWYASHCVGAVVGFLRRA